MRIGELAGMTGTTARALRHYEQAGLISSERAPNGYRVYGERAVVRVRNIRHLLAAGLTLDDVQAFLPCLDGDVSAAPPSEKGLRIARDRLAVLEERIAAQTEARDRLASALRRHEDRRDAGDGETEEDGPGRSVDRADAVG
ncbi:MerR family transcriptional regulator [Streptomyces yaizuensis]|uniref:MerR family transcriptional regulator n=1 Tax=Streptomyces yaizuensis TaxID=2989713 RepID=A0ABQ5P9E3_9ACTN|nr:MerR family transcriptional regulator [Streptomyces sp. YSPA8]GLF99198.1 MerR family transcriptional regulator [Streptomyces sp. YSPA8]